MMQVCVRRGVLCALRRTTNTRYLSAVPAPAPDTEGTATIPPHVSQIADQICGLSLHETGQLTKLLKERLGIGDIAMAAPAAAAAAPATAAEPEPEPVVEEKTSFDVKLLGINPSMKIKLIKAVKEALPELNLVAAKKLVEGAPCTVKEKVPKADAEALKAKLSEFGGDVSLE